MTFSATDGACADYLTLIYLFDGQSLNLLKKSSLFELTSYYFWKLFFF